MSDKLAVFNIWHNCSLIKNKHMVLINVKKLFDILIYSMLFNGDSNFLFSISYHFMLNKKRLFIFCHIPLTTTLYNVMKLLHHCLFCILYQHQHQHPNKLLDAWLFHKIINCIITPKTNNIKLQKFWNKSKRIYDSISTYYKNI